MKWLYLLILLLASHYSLSQKKHIVDSLENKIQSTTVIEEKGKALIELVKHYVKPDLAKAEETIKRLLKFSQQNNYKYGIGYALKAQGGILLTARNSPKQAIHFFKKAVPYFEKSSRDYANLWANIGLSYQFQGSYDSALHFMKYSLDVSTQNNIDFFIDYNANNIGNTYRQQSEYDSALKYLSIALLNKQEKEDSASLASTINNIALVYQNKGSYENAISFYLRALKICEAYNNLSELGNTYLNLGILEQQWKNYKTAKDYYLKAYGIFKSSENKRNLGATLLNIGTVFSDLQIQDSAEVYYMEALILFEGVNDKQGKAIALGNLGEINIKKANYKKAIEYLLKSIPINKETGANKSLVYDYSNIGWAYAGIRSSNQSILYLTKSSELVKVIDDVEAQLQVYSSYYHAFKLLNIYDSSLFYLEKFESLKDSLFTVEQKENMQELQTKYETEKKDKENQKLSFENKLKDEKLSSTRKFNIFLVIIISVSFFVIALLVLFSKIVRQKNKEISFINRKLEIKTNTIEEHKSNMFHVNENLYANIESIKDFEASNKIDVIRSMVKAHMLIVRFIFDDGDEFKYVNLSAFLAELIQIIRNTPIPSDKKVNIFYKKNHTVEAHEEIGRALAPVIDELIRNAIKHADYPKQEGLIINISLEMLDRQTGKLSVNDNGQTLGNYDGSGSKLIRKLLSNIRATWEVPTTIHNSHSIIFPLKIIK